MRRGSHTPKRTSKPTALAIGAHPDDIEFSMAGTLLLLRQAGWKIHCLILASGSCGSVRAGPAATRSTRWAEAQRAAAILGAKAHHSFVDDLEIFYELRLLRRLAAVVRQIKPRIVLTHPPEDYMEDHTNTCRLAVTAVFARGMANFRTVPAHGPVAGDTSIYHCMPHGLHDPLRRQVVPGAFVNSTQVHPVKRAALAAHRSQKEWLDVSQGFDSYLETMDRQSLALGTMSGRFRYAEAWWRHSHLGFAAADTDPLQEVLGQNYAVNPNYQRKLEKGF